MKKVLELNSTPHTNGYTMKVDQRKPRLKHDEKYALAYKDILKRKALEHPHPGDKTAVTWTKRSSPQETAVNAFNSHSTANAAPTERKTVNPNTEFLTHANKSPNPCSSSPMPKPPPSNRPILVPFETFEET